MPSAADKTKVPLIRWCQHNKLGGPEPGAMQSYWYVKVRHTETDRQVQRLSTANGATTEAEAALEMWQYLVRVGHIDREHDAWEIVEVTRWPRQTLVFARPLAPAPMVSVAAWRRGVSV